MERRSAFRHSVEMPPRKPFTSPGAPFTESCAIRVRGERYMSTPLFEVIPEDMTGEEVTLSRSTPGYQMG